MVVIGAQLHQCVNDANRSDRWREPGHTKACSCTLPSSSGALAPQRRGRIGTLTRPQLSVPTVV